VGRGQRRSEGVEEPPAQAGWHAFLTGWVAADILNPVMMGFMNASCFPGLFLAVTVLAVNMLGDGLRDTLDPRLRQRQ
jgi:ABC-type dipeptide/oligopeptide/nickel transport system permease subunit